MKFDKKALVTGASGFVGLNVCRELLNRGYVVTGVDPVGPGDMAIISNITHLNNRYHENYTQIYTDFRELLNAWRREHFSTKFDIVVHAAAESPHRVAIDTNVGMFSNNVNLDSYLINWMIKTQQPALIYISSSAVYPVQLQGIDHLGRRLAEKDVNYEFPRNPDKTYGLTKLFGEYMAANAAKTGMKVTIVRPFSGYGEDQNLSFPFSAFIHRAINRESPFKIWGDATQIRDWIHIDDFVKGMLAVHYSHTGQNCMPFISNICSGVGVSLFQLYREICTAVGYNPGVDVDRNAPMGVYNRVGDDSIFAQLYTPTVSLSEGIQRSIEFQRNRYGIK